jgi:hypothetical protein
VSNYPLGLSNLQAEQVWQLAQPLARADRAKYLQRFAELLSLEVEVGDGSVSRAARPAQSEFLRPMVLSTSVPKYSRTGARRGPLHLLREV